VEMDGLDIRKYRREDSESVVALIRSGLVANADLLPEEHRGFVDMLRGLIGQYVDAACADDLADIATTYDVDESESKELVGGFWVVARRDSAGTGGDKVLGTVALRARPKRTAELLRMSIDPSLRGVGMGQRLVGLVEKHAKDRGFEKIVLSTLNIFKPALSLYRKCGFAHVESTPLPVPDLEVDPNVVCVVLYEKSLKSGTSENFKPTPCLA